MTSIYITNIKLLMTNDIFNQHFTKKSLINLLWYKIKTKQLAN